MKIKNLKNKFFLHYGDLIDAGSIFEIIKKIKPNEIYNLAAQSHVGVSFKLPNYTTQVNALGTLNILDTIKKLNLEKKTKFYQASTSGYLVKFRKKDNQKKQNSILKAHMLLPNYLHIG